MSVNPNQTNINANTTYYQPPLVPQFPYGAIFSQSGTAPILLQTQNPAIWSVQPALMTLTSDGINEETIGGLQFFAYYSGPSAFTQKSGMYGASNIYYQGSNGSGFQTNFLNVNDTKLGDPSNSAFALNGVSSIQTSNFTANTISLLSSLKGTFPTSFI